MTMHGEIKAKRKAAAKARRLAYGVTQDDVRHNLLALAIRLDAEADALEKGLAVTIPASEPALRAAPLTPPAAAAIPPDQAEKSKR